MVVVWGGEKHLNQWLHEKGPDAGQVLQLGSRWCWNWKAKKKGERTNLIRNPLSFNGLWFIEIAKQT